MSTTSPGLHFPAGWGLAFDESRRGRAWIVSAFVTVTDLPWTIQKGDRVLLRGLPGDVVVGATDTGALRRFRDAGAEIRALPNLHAKLYVCEDGQSQVAWAGSANLTGAGKGSSRDGSRHNIEAMAGPFVTSDLLSPLQRLWSRADSVDIEALEVEAKRIRDEEARRLALSWTGGFFIATLHRRTLSASISMKREWFLEDPENAPATGRHTVRLVPSEEAFWKFSSGLTKKVLDALRRHGVLQSAPIGRGRYLVAVEDQDYLVAALDAANRRLASTPDAGTGETLVDSLEQRVETMLRRLLTAPDGLPTPSRAVQEAKIADGRRAARERLRSYLGSGAAGISYEISIPVSTNEPETQEVIRQWRERGATIRPRLYGNRPADPGGLVSEAERAGIRDR